MIKEGSCALVWVFPGVNAISKECSFPGERRCLGSLVGDFQNPGVQSPGLYTETTWAFWGAGMNQAASTPSNKEQGAPQRCVKWNAPKCLHMSQTHLAAFLHKSGLCPWFPEASGRHHPPFSHTKVIPPNCSIILSKSCQCDHDAVQSVKGKTVTPKNT